MDGVIYEVINSDTNHIVQPRKMPVSVMKYHHSIPKGLRRNIYKLSIIILFKHLLIIIATELDSTVRGSHYKEH